MELLEIESDPDPSLGCCRRITMEIMETERNPDPRDWCWRMRTMLERALIASLTLAALIIISLIIVTMTKSSVAKNTRNAGSHCETGTCLQHAYNLIDSMNTTIDPCDDFYEFACGGYLKKILIPRHGTIIEPSNRIEDYVSYQLRYELEEPSLPTDIEPYVMLRRTYAACMDTSTIENSGLDQMKLLLKILGGWPMLEGDAWVEIDWIDVTERLRQYGFDTRQFLKIDLEPNEKSEYFIAIDKWSSMYDIYDPNYQEFLNEFAVQFGADKELIINEVAAVQEFRENLSKFAVFSSESYKMITIGDLQLKYPSISWLHFLNVALAIPNVTLTNEESVGVRSFEYITEFVKIIKQTPKRVQVNHALLEIIRSRINFLPNYMRKTEHNFFPSSTGVVLKRERWQTCLLMVMEHFHVAIDALYIRTYGNNKAKEDVTEIESNIKNMFIRGLKKVKWMDKENKATAVEKIKMMSANIAYPVEMQNESNVIQFYKGLTLDSQYILEQVNRVSKFKRDKKMNFYRNPALRSGWDSPLESFFINKFYSEQENSIYIPLSIMQHEYYTSDRPMSMNYGGIGFLIAHELAHAFSSFESTDDPFAVKSRCLVEQYNNYTLPGNTTHVNGEHTLSKNIADNFGVTATYLAYLDWIQTHKQQPTLPGLNLTDKQVFWLSLANTRCSKYKEEYEPALSLDTLAPNRFRILGSFSNTQDFARDFNCPLGSKMNPIKKCQLW